MELLSWEELVSRPFKPIPFLLDPYIVEKGVTFLYGDTGQGKSPLTWNMARAIGTGTPFFGLPSKKGKVLYVETDTPDVVAQPRLRLLQDPVPNVYFMFYHGILPAPNIPPEKREQLKEAYHEVEPDVVFLNSLVKVHGLDDKEPKTPSIVYGYYQDLFPKSALFFTHHIRKQSLDPRMREVDKEAFSGSKHWIDDAQVGIFLQGNGYDGEKVLIHTKSQASRLIRPLPLILAADGTTISSPLFEEYCKVYEDFNEWLAGGGGEVQDFDRIEALKTGMGIGTVKKRRLDIQNHRFPNSRGFLERAGEHE